MKKILALLGLIILLFNFGPAGADTPYTSAAVEICGTSVPVGAPGTPIPSSSFGAKTDPSTNVVLEYYEEFIVLPHQLVHDVHHRVVKTTWFDGSGRAVVASGPYYVPAVGGYSYYLPPRTVPSGYIRVDYLSSYTDLTPNQSVWCGHIEIT